VPGIRKRRSRVCGDAGDEGKERRELEGADAREGELKSLLDM
jgi:hypothetical protein